MTAADRPPTLADLLAAGFDPADHATPAEAAKAAAALFPAHHRAAYHRAYHAHRRHHQGPQPSIAELRERGINPADYPTPAAAGQAAKAAWPERGWAAYYTAYNNHPHRTTERNRRSTAEYRNDRRIREILTAATTERA